MLFSGDMDLPAVTPRRVDPQNVRLNRHNARKDPKTALKLVPGETKSTPEASQFYKFTVWTWGQRNQLRGLILSTRRPTLGQLSGYVHQPYNVIGLGVNSSNTFDS